MIGKLQMEQEARQIRESAIEKGSKQKKVAQVIVTLDNLFLFGLRAVIRPG